MSNSLSPEMVQQVLTTMMSAKKQADDAIAALREERLTLEQMRVNILNDQQRFLQNMQLQVTQAAQQEVSDTLAGEMAMLNHAVNAAMARLEQATQGYERAAQVAETAVGRKTRLGYIAILGMILAAFLGIGVVTYLQKALYSKMDDNISTIEVSTEQRQMASQLGLTSCGGQPCARWDKQAPHWGEKADYVLLYTQQQLDERKAKSRQPENHAAGQ